MITFVLRFAQEAGETPHRLHTTLTRNHAATAATVTSLRKCACAATRDHAHPTARRAQIGHAFGYIRVSTYAPLNATIA